MYFVASEFVQKLARDIRKSRPDIVHILTESNIWMNLLLLLVGTRPVLTTVHDVQFHPGDESSRRIPRTLINMLIQRSDAIIVHGDDMRNAAQDDLGVPSEKCFVFPHLPLDRPHRVASRYGYSKPHDGIFRVLFFGRMYKYKGLRYLIEAAPLVKEKIPNARFVIAGSGVDLDNHRTKIEALPYC